MEKMTIHRALSELKIIDERIDKATLNIETAGISQGDSTLVNGNKEKEEFNKTAKSNYDSITSLLKRKQDLKSAITKTNAVTKVKVGDQTLTISDAINYKHTTYQREDLINRLKHNIKNAKVDLEQKNELVDKNALILAQNALSKDNVKLTDNDVINVTAPYIKKHKFVLVDPLNSDELIDKMQNELDEFITEVDAVLSEANAVTFIEI